MSIVLFCPFGCAGEDEPRVPMPRAEAGEAGDVGDPGNGMSGAGAEAAGAAAMGGAGNSDTPQGDGGIGGQAMGGADGDGEAGAAGAGAQGAVVVKVGIIEQTTRFLEYGKLRIAFERGVDAETLAVDLSPRLPDKLVVTGTSQVDDATVDVSLGYYHLPRDYQLSVSGSLSDGTPFEASGEIPGLGNGARAAFLSEQAGTGALSSWPGVPDGATPLEAADSVCQKEAEAAGLRGTFQAFLSVYGSVDAGCRALGRDGTITNNCGAAAMPVDRAPFLSIDGRPIADGATGIMADSWAIPIPFHANGKAATPFYTWAGSISGAKGFNNADCAGWTATTGNGLPTRQSGERLVEYEFSTACSSVAALLCLQTTGTFFGPSNLHHAGVKRAFVSKGKLFGAMSFDAKTGVAAADALCQSEAAGASLANADKFKAYLGTNETDALCYVLGQGGKVADNCGLDALSARDPWRRVDDYPIGSAAELAAGSLTAPLSLAADGTRMTSERPRTGTQLDGSTTWNCDDWSGTASYSLSGHPGFITGDFTSHWTTDCDSEETSVYCFEN